MSLWTIFRSPLMFGGDLPSSDPFILNMLTHEEILYVLKNSKNNRLLLSENDRKIWIADDTESPDKCAAIFCMTDDQPIDESLGFYNSPFITHKHGEQSTEIQDNECVEHTEGATVQFHVFKEHPSGSEPRDSLKIDLDFDKLGLKGACHVRDL